MRANCTGFTETHGVVDCAVMGCCPLHLCFSFEDYKQYMFWFAEKRGKARQICIMTEQNCKVDFVRREYF